MKLKEKIATYKLRAEINDILCGLNIESTEDFFYIKDASALEIVKESQKYAKILYDIIKSLKEQKDFENYRILKQVIDQYGTWKERSRRGASRGPGCYGIELILPDEIKVKLNNLYEKFLSNEKMKLQKLENQIDNIMLK